MLSLKKIILYFSLSIFISLIIVLAVAFFFTIRSADFLKKYQFQQASISAEKAYKPVYFLNKLTFNLSPTFVVWQYGLSLVQQSAKLEQEIATFLSNPQQESIIPFLDSLDEVSVDFDTLISQLQKSFLKRKLKIDSLTQAQQLFHDVQTLLTHLVRDDKSYLVVLQNSEEIRATGGFMGSYAILSFNEGKMTEADVFDIYEPDGQFTGFVEAPAGLKEYLSSGNGMRLPDSNWQADFPRSAQQILYYFSLAQKQNLDGVIAINLKVLENVLTILGDVYLPDYEVTVTSQNLAEIARKDRQEFFPGSQQKPQFLSALYKKIKIITAGLPLQQKVLIAKQVMKETQVKNIQFYSIWPEIQNLIENYNLGGELKANSLMLVESNVGINKANKNIKRDVQITINDKKLVIDVDFYNQNLPSSDSLLYANYQRVMMPFFWQVEKITVGGEVIESWDEEIISNTKGDEFRQIGFITSIAEKQQQKITIEVNTGQKVNNLFIQKQSGLPFTLYTVIKDNEVKSFVLEKDEEISF